MLIQFFICCMQRFSVLTFVLFVSTPVLTQQYFGSYRCSNGAEFSLSGDLTSAIRWSGVRIDLGWGGNSFVLISDNGVSNSRLVGNSGYQIIFWKDIKIMRYGNSLGVNCKKI